MRTKINITILLFLALLSNSILSQTPGNINWELDLGGIIYSCPAIGDDGTIYVTSIDSKLYAVNADGTKKWEFVTGDMIYSSPVLGNDGTIYFGSNDKKLYAVNSDGTKKWEFTTDDKITATPAISHNGTIYIGSYDKNIYAINSDGTLNWKFQTNGSILHPPIIGHDGTIYQVSNDNNLYSINFDGTLKWKLGSEFPFPLVIDEDGTIYIYSLNNYLHAFYPDGSQKWKLKLTNTIDVENAQIVIGSENDLYIHRYSYGAEDGDQAFLFSVTKSGVINWRYKTYDDGLSNNKSLSPIVGNDGTIYVNGYYSRLFAFNPDGSVNWVKRYTTSNPYQLNYLDSTFSSILAMDKNGNIIAGNLQGKLFSIFSGSNSLAESPWPKFSKTYKNQASYFNKNYPHALVAENEISTLTGKAVLDGTNSYDPNGENLSYFWSLIKILQMVKFLLVIQLLLK
ncbi:MAG: PQQ-like beta-propeller repeat protein [Ignavibacteriae bacterium]|nr:PQQ-like beta-propeller repeat protein [Ignavibacteriota bacterium]